METHVNEPECDYSDMHKKVAKMIELKQHLFSKAKENIESAQLGTKEIMIVRENSLRYL